MEAIKGVPIVERTVTTREAEDADPVQIAVKIDFNGDTQNRLVEWAARTFIINALQTYFRKMGTAWMKAHPVFECKSSDFLKGEKTPESPEKKAAREAIEKMLKSGLTIEEIMTRLEK